MTTRHLDITYTEYAGIDELDAQDKELALSAIDAVKNSYAPYSQFNVGAAIRLEGGLIIQGANQENAAFPSGICAERSALFAAGAQHPDKPVRSIAVTGGLKGVIMDNPATPCGACRQVMSQFQLRAGAPISVILVGAKSVWKFEKVDDILPFIFDSI